MSDQDDPATTYGEACDEAIASAILTIAKLDRAEARARAFGDDEQAAELEDAADQLQERTEELIETREQLPFEILDEQELEAFLASLGL